MTPLCAARVSRQTSFSRSTHPITHVSPQVSSRVPCAALRRTTQQVTAATSDEAPPAATSQSSLPAAEPGITVLGFVGTGIMGVPMAKNLIKAGYSVVVYNRDSAKCKPLEELGAQIASSPSEVASRATYTFAMLSDPAAALQVATGPNGIVSGLSAGKGYIDVSTIDVATSQLIAAAVRSSGASFLEAPVSGSKAPAEQGKLIFLTAGDQALFDAVSGPLASMGKAQYFLGEVGAGAKMKLVVNMLLGSLMTSFAEALALGGKVGLKPADVLEVVGLGAAAAPMFAVKGPAMVVRSYSPAFPLKHQQKDLRLVLELGASVDQALPMAAAANGLFLTALHEGHGDEDFSAVLEAVLTAKESQGMEGLVSQWLKAGGGSSKQ
ncbi:MAG: hypothetical protein WDW38_004726 [Sanguina aurantia]